MDIRRYRNEGQTIYYFDETLANAGEVRQVDNIACRCICRYVIDEEVLKSNKIVLSVLPYH